MVLAMGLIPLLSSGKEYSKTVTKQFQVNPQALLEIVNKYGEVDLSTNQGSTIDIRVEIKVEARSDASGQELLESVQISMNGSADNVTAKTILNRKNYKGLKINYKVTLPRSNSIDIVNRFGNVVLDELDGDATVGVSYGGFMAGSLNSKKNSVKVMYGKGSITKAGYLDLKLRYTDDFKVGKVKLLNLDTQYSESEIGSVGRLNLDAAYDDIEVLAAAELNAEAQYTDVEVNSVTQKAEIRMQYGDVSIDRISNTFKEVNVRLQYGDAELGFESGSNFSLDASVQYADLILPAGKWDDKRKTLSRTVLGSVDDNPSSSVVVRCSYGDVKLEMR